MDKKKIKIFIVEDMAISRAGLEAMLIKNEYEILGSVAKAETAWNQIQNLPLDLILLDINLAGQKNGVWLAQQIRKHLNIPIVYLTAYGDQQTLKEVLDTKPNGYLMKPYQEPTLLTTINIALTNFLEHQKKTQVIQSTNNENIHLFIKDRSIKVKLFVKDICYIKSDGNYLEIILKEKKHIVRNKLLEFKKQLPHTLFFQSHQRYLINIGKVDVLSKKHILINEEEIPLSTKYKAEIEKALTIVQ